MMETMGTPFPPASRSFSLLNTSHCLPAFPICSFLQCRPSLSECIKNSLPEVDVSLNPKKLRYCLLLAVKEITHGHVIQMLVLRKHTWELARKQSTGSAAVGKKAGLCRPWERGKKAGLCRPWSRRAISGQGATSATQLISQAICTIVGISNIPRQQNNVK